MDSLWAGGEGFRMSDVILHLSLALLAVDDCSLRHWDILMGWKAAEAREERVSENGVSSKTCDFQLGRSVMVGARARPKFTC